MRELKVFLRRDVLEAVMHTLHDAGVNHVVVSHVQSFGSGVDPKHWRLSMDAGGQYTDHAKLEFVCAETDVDRLAALVRAKAHTGEPGDGIIFISAVERAIKIRTGAEDRNALR